jgi:flavin reductase (DIM6/NTAB) family NADH-FMN oxidoreductase RutF
MSMGFTGVADGFEHIEIQSLSRAQRYNVLTGAIIPRPIAFVTSVGIRGVVNAAPFSQFVILAVDPGLLGFSIGPRTHDSTAKDTLANVSETGEFVVNMVPEGWEGIVQQASVEHPSDVSEVDLLGLNTIASTKIKVPRLVDSKIQFECTLDQIINFGDAPNHFVVGRIVAMHVRTGLLHDDKIDPAAYAPIARIGGRNYVRLGDIVKV